MLWQSSRRNGRWSKARIPWMEVERGKDWEVIRRLCRNYKVCGGVVDGRNHQDRMEVEEMDGGMLRTR